MSLVCARCSAMLRSPIGDWVRCQKCGAVHHADGTVISPVMTPAFKLLDVDGAHVARGGYVARLSPWMLPQTRPIHGGWYEVRFGELITPLWWDNYTRQFTAGYLGQRVNCRTLTSWRGGWAE